MKFIKIAVSVVGALVILAAVFFAGGTMGFAYGFSFRAALTAPSEAMMVVSVLKRMRRGDTEGAIQSLELQLDTRIIEHGLYL